MLFAFFVVVVELFFFYVVMSLNVIVAQSKISNVLITTH